MRTRLGRRREVAADRQRRSLMREVGLTPTRPSHAYRVHCSVVPIPDWARANLVRDFSQGETYVWMAHRTKAHILGVIDREAGGIGEVLKVEMRRCGVCGMVYLEEEARARRLVEEGDFRGKMTPCGPECVVKRNAKRSRREGWSL